MTNHETPPQPTNPSDEAVRNLAKASLTSLDADFEAADRAEKGQVDLDLDAFEEAEQNLYDAEQLVPEGTFTKENLDVIIGNIEKVLQTETDVDRFDEAEKGLDMLIDARGRLEVAIEPDFDAIFDNYNAMAQGKKRIDPDVATRSEIEFARNDLLAAINQMKNDTEAYKYLHVVLTNDPKLLNHA